MGSRMAKSSFSLGSIKCAYLHRGILADRVSEILHLAVDKTAAGVSGKALADVFCDIKDSNALVIFLYNIVF